ncbi:hypothetical protein FD754_008996, partial [Muntiacus muntjak]
IQAIFLFQMGYKAAETTHNINNTFGSGTANKCTVQWWFKKFCKEDKSLEVRKVAEELNIYHSGRLKQIGKVKKLDKWVPHELTANQKNYCFEVSFSHILHNNNKSFLNWIVMCNEKWIVMVTVWCSAACLIHYSFLNPGEIIPSEKYAQQINEMHQKLQCLQLALVTRKGSILHTNTQPHVLQPMRQKLNELSYEILFHPPYSPDFLPTDHHFFNHLNNFLQGKHFHNQQEAENAFQKCAE